MMRIRSITPLAPVLIELSKTGGCHVWLRHNLVETKVKHGKETITIYMADQLYFYSNAPPTIRL